MEADLLTRAADEVPDDPSQDRARQHDPDEARLAGEEDEIDRDSVRVRDDEDGQDHCNEQRDEELRHPALTCFLELPVMLVVELVFRARWDRCPSAFSPHPKLLVRSGG